MVVNDLKENIKKYFRPRGYLIDIKKGFALIIALFLVVFPITALVGNFPDAWLKNLYLSLGTGIIGGFFLGLIEIARVRNRSVSRLNKSIPYGRYSWILGPAILGIIFLLELSLLTIFLFFMIGIAVPLLFASRKYGREKRRSIL